MSIPRTTFSVITYQSRLSRTGWAVRPVFTRQHSFTCYFQPRRLNHTSSNMNEEEQQKSLISFWFDRNSDDWFIPPKGFDEEIRARFGALVTQARADKLDHWSRDPSGTVCLLLLLDQFPRNLFRGSGESFSSDDKALQISKQGMAQQFDIQVGRMSRFQQTLFYLPFMHAENIPCQERSKVLYQHLIKECEVDTPSHKHATKGLSNARSHLACIAQFGRFPARNKALGRPNTKEEEEFLKKYPNGLLPDPDAPAKES